MKIIQEARLNNPPNRLRIKDEKVFMACKSGGVNIFDKENLSLLLNVDSFNAWDVDYKSEEKLLSVADKGTGCLIYSLEEFNSPRKLFHVADYNVETTRFAGRFLLAGGSSGARGVLRVMDIHNSFSVVKEIETGSAILDIHVEKKEVFLSMAKGEVKVLSIPDFHEVGTYHSDAPGSWGLGVSYSGGLIFFSNWKNGVEIIERKSMRRVNIYKPVDAVYQTYPDGKYLYVANAWGGLKIIDISDIGKIKEVHTFKVAHTNILDVEVDEDYVYMVDNGRFRIIKGEKDVS